MFTGFLLLLAVCALIVLAALLAIWLLKFLQCPAEPARYITAAIWICAGVAILLRLFRWIGVY